MITLRPEVQKFAELMEIELQKYDGIKPGWKKDNAFELVEKAEDHMFSCWESDPKDQRIEQLVKAGNYLMMAVDILSEN